jgi:hypothetical protein
MPPAERWFLARLIFGHEVGGVTFLRNVVHIRTEGCYIPEDGNICYNCYQFSHHELVLRISVNYYLENLQNKVLLSHSEPKLTI